jgi:hypothetical protein
MCVWRIFGVGHDWADRPQEARSRTFTVNSGPVQGDSTTVVVGDIPPHVLTAIGDWRAVRRLALDAALGGTHFGSLSPAEREALIESDRANLNLDDVIGHFPLWITFEVARPAELAVYSENSGKLLDDLNGFGAAANDYLVSVMARVSAALGEQLQGEQLLFAEPRAYLLSEGRRAVTVPVSDGSATLSLTSAVGWMTLPFDAIEEALRGVPDAAEPDVLYRKAARLLWSALEHERDALRRFLFAFVGLEVLANQAGGKLRNQVADSLTAELGGLPVRDLILPDRSDGEPPYRSIQFKFACLAVAVSRTTAAQDVATFRRLVKARNRLAHGATVETDDLPARDCVELLRRYVSLVASDRRSSVAKP